MLSLIRFTIIDYVKNWHLALEIFFCLVFLYFVFGGKPPPISIIGNIKLPLAIFCLILASTTTIRLARKAWNPDSHYLIISKSGKIGYFLAQFFSALIIDCALIIIITIIALLYRRLDPAPMVLNLNILATRFFLLLLLLALGSSISLLFSRLTANRWLFLASFGIILALSFSDVNILSEPLAKSIFALLELYGPPLKTILNLEYMTSSHLVNLSSVIFKSLAYIIAFMAAGTIVFIRKELVFND